MDPFRVAAPPSEAVVAERAGRVGIRQWLDGSLVIAAARRHLKQLPVVAVLLRGRLQLWWGRGRCGGMPHRWQHTAATRERPCNCKDPIHYQYGTYGSVVALDRDSVVWCIVCDADAGCGAEWIGRAPAC